LREIDCHPIHELSRLRIGVHLFMAERGNGRGAVQKLCSQQNEQHEHTDRHQEFSQRKAAAAATLFQCKSAYAPQSRAL